MPHPHKKGATIAYTYALSTQKSIERAQLSPMPQEKSLLNPLNPCEPKSTTKRDSCEEKGSEGGVGTTSFGAFP